MNRAKRRQLYLILTLLFVFSFNFYTWVAGEPDDNFILVDMEGYVNVMEGAPVDNATLVLFRHDRVYDRLIVYEITRSDAQGYYRLTSNISAEPMLSLAVYCDRDDTPGFDWLPHLKILDAEGIYSGRCNFTLRTAATMYFKAPLRLVDQLLEIKPTYRLVVPETGEVYSYSNYSLVYGDDIIHRDLFELNGSTVLVPAGTPLLVDCIYYNISDFDGEPLSLVQGELVTLDNREYSLPRDVVLVESLSGSTWTMITRAESYGFYTTSEVQMHQKAGELLHTATEAYSRGAYEEAYIALRTAYLSFKRAESSIDSLFVDAYTSTNVIIFILAVSSFSMTPFLVQGKFRKIGLSTVIFAVLLGYIYIVYPGLRLTPPLKVAAVSVASLLFTPVVDIAFRWFLKKGKKGGIVLYDSLSSAFSMATQNLKRRRLRSAFTFATLFTMTLSFIALTSLTVSYGLINQPLLMKQSSVDGLMMRMHEYQFNAPEPQYWEIGRFYPVQKHTLDWLKSHEGVMEIAPKAEYQPNEQEFIMGLKPEVDSLMPAIDAVVTLGESLRQEGTCLLHEARLGRADKGDVIYVPFNEFINYTLPVYEVGEYYDGLRIVGGVSNEILSVNDIDGESVMPRVIKIAFSTDKYVRYDAFPCDPERLVITTMTDALEHGCQISRVNIIVESSSDLELSAQSLALGSGYRYWVSQKESIDYIALGDVLEGKGFSLTVPYAIVILTVITTMLGSWYERRNEIDILSSIGLNPGHITGIFLSESILLGLAAGTLGYLAGLGLYPLMAHLSFAPAIHQKISANWSLGAIGISLSSALIGTLVALRQSISLTPSLKTRWNVREGITDAFDNYLLEMPVALTDAQIEEFVDFLENSLSRMVQTEKQVSRSRLKGVFSLTRRVSETEAGRRYRISFMHIVDDYWNVTSNAIVVQWNPKAESYDVSMTTKGMEEGAANVGRLIRHIIMEWSTSKPEK